MNSTFKLIESTYDPLRTTYTFKTEFNITIEALMHMFDKSEGLNLRDEMAMVLGQELIDFILANRVKPK